MTDPDYARVLRTSADAFVMTVAVIAEREGREQYVVASEAITDAMARLTEDGTLGGDDEDE